MMVNQLMKEISAVSYIQVPESLCFIFSSERRHELLPTPRTLIYSKFVSELIFCCLSVTYLSYVLGLLSCNYF